MTIQARQIKFRARDKLSNHMIPREKFIEFENERSKTYKLTDYRILTEYHEWQPMQFIWQKDINWKEIYEGDIVKYKQLEWFGCDYEDYKTDPKATEHIDVVTRHENHWRYPIEVYNEVEDWYYSMRTFNLEVIGNVFENPDLDPNKR